MGSGKWLTSSIPASKLQRRVWRSEFLLHVYILSVSSETLFFQDLNPVTAFLGMLHIKILLLRLLP